MFSVTQDLFRFLLEMGKSCPKELFKIARCFRSYFVSLFESFQKVTERSRMLVTIQTRILNTFSKQGTKIIQGNIMWVSNFHMNMYGNVLKFWCYDPNLCSPGQGGFYRFPSVHPFLTHSCLLFTEFSSACNWKQASQSPVLPRSAEHIFCDPSYSFFLFFLFFLLFFFHGGRKKGKITTGIWGNGLWKSSLSHSLTSCALNEKQK